MKTASNTVDLLEVDSTPAQVDNTSALTVPLLEYEKLKDEQTARISNRDNLIYATLGAAAVVGFGALQTNLVLLLLLAPVGALLGWTSITNDDKVKAIGRYMRLDLSPRLEALTGQPLGWETDRDDPRRTSRKLHQLGVNLLTFAGPGCAGVVAVLASRDSFTVTVLAGWYTAIVILFVLCWQIIVHADLTPTERA